MYCKEDIAVQLRSNPQTQLRHYTKHSYATPPNIVTPHHQIQLRHFTKYSYATPPNTTKYSYGTPNIAMPQHQIQQRHTPRHSYAKPPNIATPHHQTQLRHTPKHSYATPPNIDTPPNVKGDYFIFFFYVYSTLLHLPPLRFHLCRRMLGSNPGLLRHWH